MTSQPEYSLGVAVGGLALFWAAPALGQNPPSGTARVDSLRRYTLAPVVVSVTRAAVELSRIPVAVQSVSRAELERGRQTLGLDEALSTVPGVHLANRYNFSLDR